MNFRFTLVLLIVAILVVAGVAIGQKKAPSAAPTITPTPVLFKLQLTNVTGFDIKAGSQETQLASSDGKWSLVKPVPDSNVDQTKITDLVSQMTSLSGVRTVGPASGDLKPYGLDAPQLSATLTLKSGQPQTLLVGNRNVDGNYYYAMTQGGADVSLISASVVQQLQGMAATPPRATPTPTPTNTPVRTPTPAGTAGATPTP